MDNELLDYLFNHFKNDSGFEGDKDSFIKFINEDEDLLNHSYSHMLSVGFEGNKEDFSKLVGVATEQPKDEITEATEEVREQNSGSSDTTATPTNENKVVDNSSQPKPNDPPKFVDPNRKVSAVSHRFGFQEQDGEDYLNIYTDFKQEGDKDFGLYSGKLNDKIDPNLTTLEGSDKPISSILIESALGDGFVGRDAGNGVYQVSKSQIEENAKLRYKNSLERQNDLKRLEELKSKRPVSERGGYEVKTDEEVEIEKRIESGAIYTEREKEFLNRLDLEKTKARLNSLESRDAFKKVKDALEYASYLEDFLKSDVFRDMGGELDPNDLPIFTNEKGEEVRPPQGIDNKTRESYEKVLELNSRKAEKAAELLELKNKGSLKRHAAAVTQANELFPTIKELSPQVEDILKSKGEELKNSKEFKESFETFEALDAQMKTLRNEMSRYSPEEFKEATKALKDLNSKVEKIIPEVEAVNKSISSTVAKYNKDMKALEAEAASGKLTPLEVNFRLDQIRNNYQDVMKYVPTVREDGTEIPAAEIHPKIKEYEDLVKERDDFNTIYEEKYSPNIAELDRLEKEYEQLTPKYNDALGNYKSSLKSFNTQLAAIADQDPTVKKYYDGLSKLEKLQNDMIDEGNKDLNDLIESMTTTQILDSAFPIFFPKTAEYKKYNAELQEYSDMYYKGQIKLEEIPLEYREEVDTYSGVLGPVNRAVANVGLSAFNTVAGAYQIFNSVFSDGVSPTFGEGFLSIKYMEELGNRLRASSPTSEQRQGIERYYKVKNSDKELKAIGIPTGTIITVDGNGDFNGLRDSKWFNKDTFISAESREILQNFLDKNSDAIKTDFSIGATYNNALPSITQMLVDLGTGRGAIGLARWAKTATSLRAASKLKGVDKIAALRNVAGSSSKPLSNLLSNSVTFSTSYLTMYSENVKRFAADPFLDSGEVALFSHGTTALQSVLETIDGFETGLLKWLDKSPKNKILYEKLTKEVVSDILTGRVNLRTAIGSLLQTLKSHGFESSKEIITEIAQEAVGTGAEVLTGAKTVEEFKQAFNALDVGNIAVTTLFTTETMSLPKLAGEISETYNNNINSLKANAYVAMLDFSEDEIRKEFEKVGAKKDLVDRIVKNSAEIGEFFLDYPGITDNNVKAEIAHKHLELFKVRDRLSRSKKGTEIYDKLSSDEIKILNELNKIADANTPKATPAQVAASNLITNTPQAIAPQPQPIVVQPPSATPNTGSNVTDVNDSEYKDFVDRGVVTQDRINSIAEKIKNGESLTGRENEIFNSKTSEINDRLVVLRNQETNAQPDVDENSPEFMSVIPMDELEAFDSEVKSREELDKEAATKPTAATQPVEITANVKNSVGRLTGEATYKKDDAGNWQRIGKNGKTINVKSQAVIDQLNTLLNEKEGQQSKPAPEQGTDSTVEVEIEAKKTGVERRRQELANDAFEQMIGRDARTREFAQIDRSFGVAGIVWAYITGKEKPNLQMMVDTALVDIKEGLRLRKVKQWIQLAHGLNLGKEFFEIFEKELIKQNNELTGTAKSKQEENLEVLELAKEINAKYDAELKALEEAVPLRTEEKVNRKGILSTKEGIGKALSGLRLSDPKSFESLQKELAKVTGISNHKMFTPNNLANYYESRTQPDAVTAAVEAAVNTKKSSKKSWLDRAIEATNPFGKGAQLNDVATGLLLLAAHGGLKTIRSAIVAGKTLKQAAEDLYNSIKDKQGVTQEQFNRAVIDALKEASAKANNNNPTPFEDRLESRMGLSMDEIISDIEEFMYNNNIVGENYAEKLIGMLKIRHNNDVDKVAKELIDSWGVEDVDANIEVNRELESIGTNMAEIKDQIEKFFFAEAKDAPEKAAATAAIYFNVFQTMAKRDGAANALEYLRNRIPTIGRMSTAELIVQDSINTASNGVSFDLDSSEGDLTKELQRLGIVTVENIETRKPCK